MFLAYGHGSWLPIVLFAGMFAVRYLSTQRRRSGRQGRPPSRSSFTGPASPAPPGVDPAAASGSRGTGTAPGWFRDPFFKHEHRYWSGSEWTEHVNDDGVPGIDPAPGSGGGGSDHGAGDPPAGD